ncbi:hypothetical protein I5U28_03205 [Stenotrophomonas maltophilia]|uniref:hypothetical protein n=1 Tax=Stenotrophomonas geniculata TaxID=86188 RepID=UPI00066C8166|nr:hypothetical protein [Stenotrophomonas geniculata]MBH1404543.1 hypothetical protein [Stenotrophomonas maltophilia]MDP9619723.1 hypothetical protein [Stenotrophomonas maltophilia]
MSGSVTDAAKDLAATVKDAWVDRLSSPLVGAFALSWLAVNYKLFFVLFSGEPYADNFVYIAQNLYPNWMWVVGKSVVGPLVLAAFYIFVVPIPGEFVYDWTLTRKQRLARIAKKVEGATLLTKEQSSEILENAARLNAQAEKAMASVEGMKEAHTDELARVARDATEARENMERTLNAEIEEQKQRASNLSRILSDMKWELTVERAAAQHAGKNASIALIEFIHARPFELTVGSSVLGAVRFGPSGTVLEGFKGEVATWELSANKSLLLNDASGGRAGSFTFNTESRTWNGYWGTRGDAKLQPEPVKVYSPMNTAH